MNSTRTRQTDEPFEDHEASEPLEGPTRLNSTDAKYVVRVFYKTQRAIEVEGEAGFMDDPHVKSIDLELNAGSDANAIALACEDLEEAIPSEVDAPDRVQVVEVRISERPTPQTDSEDPDEHPTFPLSENPPRGLGMKDAPDRLTSDE